MHTYFYAKKAGYHFKALANVCCSSETVVNILKQFWLTFIVTSSLIWSILCNMNNEKLPPARMEIQIIVDEKQVIKFAWPNSGRNVYC